MFGRSHFRSHFISGVHRRFFCIEGISTTSADLSTFYGRQCA
jgi:hypothetical protein